MQGPKLHPFYWANAVQEPVGLSNGSNRHRLAVQFDFEQSPEWRLRV